MPKKNRRKAKKAAAAKAAAAAQGAAVEGDLKTKGAKAYQRKDFKTALELFSKAIEETPEDYKLYSNRAATHYFLNAYAESLQDAKKCIELKSDWHKVETLYYVRIKWRLNTNYLLDLRDTCEREWHTRNFSSIQKPKILMQRD